MKRKSFSIVTFFPAALALAVITGACSKSGSKSMEVLDPAKAQAEVSNAFAKSTGDNSQAAVSCVAALQAQDTPAAFAQLRKISSQGDLTPEQRVAVSKAMQSTLVQLQSAAQNGNAAAQAAVRQYISSR